MTQTTRPKITKSQRETLRVALREAGKKVAVRGGELAGPVRLRFSGRKVQASFRMIARGSKGTMLEVASNQMFVIFVGVRGAVWTYGPNTSARIRGLHDALNAYA